MRDNNWEYALDASAGMGQVYANDRGQCYLSRWEFGLGVSHDGSSVSEWYDQRGLHPIGHNYAVKQIGICAAMKLAYEAA